MWSTFAISHLWQLAGMAVLLVGSAFFSGSETALFSLTSGQLHRLAASGRSGRLVASLARRPRQLLNALLLGNLIINVAYTAIAATIVFDLGSSPLPAWSAPLGSLAALVVLVLVGEVAPKIIALSATRRWALLCGAMRALLWASSRGLGVGTGRGQVARVVRCRPEASVVSPVQICIIQAIRQRR